MSYAISVPVGGYFSAQMRVKRSTARNAMRGAIMFLNQAMTPKPDVFMAVERRDAEITARDNGRNELAKLQAFQAAI